MVGNDQSDYQTMARIQEAGMGTGYKFRITSLESSAVATKGTIENKGVAPMYYDAYVAVDGVRSTMSLKGLQPGFFLEFAIAKGGSAPVGSIECDRLVPGQVIEFEADLEK